MYKQIRSSTLDQDFWLERRAQLVDDLSQQCDSDSTQIILDYWQDLESRYSSEYLQYLQFCHLKCQSYSRFKKKFKRVLCVVIVINIVVSFLLLPRPWNMVVFAVLHICVPSVLAVKRYLVLKNIKGGCISGAVCLVMVYFDDNVKFGIVGGYWLGDLLVFLWGLYTCCCIVSMRWITRLPKLQSVQIDEYEESASRLFLSWSSKGLWLSSHTGKHVEDCIPKGRCRIRAVVDLCINGFAQVDGWNVRIAALNIRVFPTGEFDGSSYSFMLYTSACTYEKLQKYNQSSTNDDHDIKFIKNSVNYSDVKNMLEFCSVIFRTEDLPRWPYSSEDEFLLGDIV